MDATPARVQTIQMACFNCSFVSWTVDGSDLCIMCDKVLLAPSTASLPGRDTSPAQVEPNETNQSNQNDSLDNFEAAAAKFGVVASLGEANHDERANEKVRSVQTFKV
jgi:hypothetical protein